MGWASYFEERLAHLRAELAEVKEYKRVEIARSDFGPEPKFIKACDSFLDEVAEHEEIATSPQMDLAHEVLDLKRTNAELEKRTAALESTYRKLRECEAKCTQLESEIERFKHKVKYRRVPVRRF